MERLGADLRELREGEALDVEAVDVFEDVGEEFDPERERESGQPRGERRSLEVRAIVPREVERESAAAAAAAGEARAHMSL